MTPEENYADITEMQATWNTSWRDKRRWIIVEEIDGTYSIHEHTSDSIAPPTIKPNKREVASRLLQLFDIGPVAPQDYPEGICIGEIEYKSADILEMRGAAMTDLDLLLEICKEERQKLPNGGRTAGEAIHGLVIEVLWQIIQRAILQKKGVKP